MLAWMIFVKDPARINVSLMEGIEAQVLIWSEKALDYLSWKLLARAYQVVH